jgi:hypothetical protein
MYYTHAAVLYTQPEAMIALSTQTILADELVDATSRAIDLTSRAMATRTYNI